MFNLNKKMKIEIVLGIILPTIVAYASFFILYNLFKVDLGIYRWFATIPFAIITGFIIRENKKEWREIQRQEQG